MDEMGGRDPVAQLADQLAQDIPESTLDALVRDTTLNDTARSIALSHPNTSVSTTWWALRNTHGHLRGVAAARIAHAPLRDITRSPTSVRRWAARHHRDTAVVTHLALHDRSPVVRARAIRRADLTADDLLALTQDPHLGVQAAARAHVAAALSHAESPEAH